MTSGQGENPAGGPYGPPPGWPPPGQQHPGYAPAPSVSYGPPPGVPREMERPLSVRAGLGAFLGSMALSAVAQVVTLINWRRILDWTFAHAGIDIGGSGAAAARQGAELGALVGIVVGLLFIAVYGLFVWFAWRGRNWARVVLWVVAGLGILSGFSGLVVGSPLPFLSALGVFQMLLLIAAVVALAMKPSNDWFRFRGWQRATGQG